MVVLPTVAVRRKREVYGFCFTPQDGNSLLSSVAAALWLIDPDWESVQQPAEPAAPLAVPGDLRGSGSTPAGLGLLSMRPVELRFGDLRIEGWSRAGDETWFRIHPPGLAFDVGRGALQLGGAQDVFLSHGHLDHALGLPYVLSQRSLHRLVHTRVFCPAEIAEPLAAPRLGGRAAGAGAVPL